MNPDFEKELFRALGNLDKANGHLNDALEFIEKYENVISISAFRGSVTRIKNQKGRLEYKYRVSTKRIPLYRK